MEGEGFLPTAWTRLKESVGQRWTRKPPRKKVVLVVENNRPLRKLLAEALRDQRHYTIEAGDGAEAVRIGARCRDEIHQLITAVRLPDLIGWELVELLRLDYPALDVVYIARNTDDCKWLSRAHKVSRFIRLPNPLTRESLRRALLRYDLARPQFVSALRLVDA
jgi:CheY-like chemotaxis protein